MIKIKVKKGFDLKISGRPSNDLIESEKPKSLAVLPEHIPFIKPRLCVEPGQKVKIGTPLFIDKRDERVVFLSPGGGEVEAVNYGKRRVIREVILKLDEHEEREEFPVLSSGQIEQKESDDIIDMLLNGGLWPLIRELPFRDIADYAHPPHAIIVSLGSKDCFLPSPEVYLAGKEDMFQYGLNVLSKLCDTVYVTSSDGYSELPDNINNKVTHQISGAYPADDPGVLLYHVKTSSEENRAWYVSGQDLISIASLLKNGSYPVHKVYAVGGGEAKIRTHVKARIGSPARLITTGRTEQSRYISGGVLKGYTLSSDSFMGFYESSLTLLKEGDEEEFFGFIRPGYGKPSFSRTFLSALNWSDMNMDCNMHGEERACINCGTCAKVCPVDIMPQFTFKCIEVQEVEETLKHGLLDCVECGLCSYVCPCKIDISQKIKQAKADYSKERA